MQQRNQPSPTFLDAPFAEDVSASGAHFAFVGIPYTTPYGNSARRSPCAAAPDAVRTAARVFEYDKLLDHYDFDCEATMLPDGVTVVDAGDTHYAWREPKRAKDEATAAVREVVAAGAIPLIVGGDDALPPIVAAGLERDVHVLHIDAHVDFRDELDGVKDGYSSPIRRLREMDGIGDIVQVGLRGIGSARVDEVADARAAGNTLISAMELHAIGAERVLDGLAADLPWFVTIDCDGLDPSVAPGVEWPEPGGVTYGQAATLVRGLAREGRIAAIEFTEFAPEHDVRALTALAICRLLMNVVTLAPAGRTSAGAASPSAAAAQHV